MTDDTVRRQAAITAVLELDVSNRVSWKDAVIDALDALPPAQPEIIRCKECKHHNWCAIEDEALIYDEEFYCKWGVGESADKE